MPLLFRKKGLAAKVETTYATDPLIAEADDSIQHAQLDVQPLDGDFVNRDLDRSVLGAQGDILVSSRAVFTFLVEAAGAGAAGTAAPYNQLFQACGFAETLNASTDAQYDPVSENFDSVWVEANHDGNKHIGRGARGNLSLSWETKQIPRLNFELRGLYEPPISEPLPTYDLSDFQVPEAFNNANTPTATLHSEAIALRSFSIDLQNQLEHQDVIGNEEILLVDRNVTGQVTFQAPLISAKDWFAAVASRAAQPLQIIHGDTAGNIFQIDAPLVELSSPRYAEDQGVLMLTADMILKPSGAGNDEIKFTIK